MILLECRTMSLCLNMLAFDDLIVLACAAETFHLQVTWPQ